MPLVRVDLVQGKSADYRKAISEVIYDAMIKTINVPKDDRFQVITELSRNPQDRGLHLHPGDAQ